MIDGLKPYPAYKSSGVPWFGEVPEHSDVRKLKHLTQFHNGLAFKPGDWSSSGIPIIRIKNLNGSNSFNYTTRTDLPDFLRIRKGDLLFSWSGNRGTSFGPFIWTRDFEGYLNQHIFKLDGYKLHRSYFAHLLRAVTAHIEEQTHGIIGLVHITKPELGSVLVPVAPVDEQRDIARFVDHADRRIRRYIRAKQKLIKLLVEEKEVIIRRAVTRGLDPNVRIKLSGVTWLAEIPEHWEIRRNGRNFVQMNDTGFSELPILEVSLKTGVRVRDLGTSDRKQIMSDRAKYKRAAKGDIAYNMMRMWQGAVGVAPVDGLVSPAYVVARPLDGVDPHYYGNLFRTRAYMSEIDRNSRGIVKDRNRLYWEDFKQLPSPYPPIFEQTQIVESIERNTQAANAAIDRIDREITLLGEYRNRATTDVVTGKLDVREAAARLPEEVPEVEPLDGMEDIPEDDGSIPEELEAADAA